jgi:hypothetical protein
MPRSGFDFLDGKLPAAWAAQPQRPAIRFVAAREARGDEPFPGLLRPIALERLRPSYQLMMCIHANIAAQLPMRLPV